MDIKSFGSGSTGNSYLISNGQDSLLIEFGIQFKKVAQQMKFDFSNVVGCLLTHEHTDHSKYVKDLMKNTNIDLYATSGTLSHIDIDGYRKKPINYREPKKIGSFIVTSFEVKHDAEEPCGFIVENTLNGERLLFATDTYLIKYKFKNLSYIMIEANHSSEKLVENAENGVIHEKLADRIVGSHMSIENTKEFILANNNEKLKEIWLLHLSDSNSNEVEFKEQIQSITGVTVLVA